MVELQETVIIFFVGIIFPITSTIKPQCSLVLHLPMQAYKDSYGHTWQLALQNDGHMKLKMSL